MFGKDTYKSHASFRTAAILLGAACLFVACARIDNPGAGPDDEWNELGGDTPVKFTSSLRPVSETKASTDFADGTQIGVFGFYHDGNGSNDGSWESDGTGNIPDFMYNQLVTKDGSSWTYTPIKYWPNETGGTTSAHIDKLSFWGYYPRNGAGIELLGAGTTDAYTNTTSGLPDIRFTQNSNARVDLMTCDLEKNLYKHDSDGHGNLSNGEVDFTFHHRLSSIGFQARIADDVPDNQTIKITKIEILYNYDKAIMAQTPAATPGSDDTISWGSYSDEETAGIVAFSNTSGLPLTKTPVACGDSPVLMIPQQLHHDDTNNDVLVRVSFIQSSGPASMPRGSSIKVSKDAVTSWAPNKKYIYTLVLSAASAFTLDLVVQPWEYRLGTSDYKENVTVTQQLFWDPDTFVANPTTPGANYTSTQSFTIDGVTSEYKVIALKPGTVLKGTFTFDTPYHGTWVAMLETFAGDPDAALVFADGLTQNTGTVGSEVSIGIRAASATISQAQYARLRFLCLTADNQVLPVQDASIGGPFVIVQYVN